MEIKEIKIKTISIVENIRQKSNGDLGELMNSIKITGLMQPIGVKKVKDGYILIWGYRRLEACKKLGYKTIPAVLFSEGEDLSEEDFLITNATENIHRKSIDMIELGRICSILRKKGLAPSEVASRLSIPITRVRSALENFMGVPEKFRKDIKLLQTGTSKKGSIGVTSSSALLRLRNVNATEKAEAFDWAKKEEKSYSEIKTLNLLLSEGISLKKAMKEVSKYKILEVKMLVDRKRSEEIIKHRGDTKRLIKKALNRLYPKLVY